MAAAEQAPHHQLARLIGYKKGQRETETKCSSISPGRHQGVSRLHDRNGESWEGLTMPMPRSLGLCRGIQGSFPCHLSHDRHYHHHTLWQCCHYASTSAHGASLTDVCQLRTQQFLMRQLISVTRIVCRMCDWTLVAYVQMWCFVQVKKWLHCSKFHWSRGKATNPEYKVSDTVGQSVMQDLTGNMYHSPCHPVSFSMNIKHYIFCMYAFILKYTWIHTNI